MKVQVKINAEVHKVWDALTRPELIKKWLFDTDTETDWQPGSPITWRGTWDGKEYEDKGQVLEVRKPVRLSYTHWSNFSGKPELPENYATVICDLQTEQQSTILTVTQNCTDAEFDKCELTWKGILHVLKESVSG